MEIVNWGEVPYPKALQKQLSLVEEVSKGLIPDQIILCTHPPVVTLGRSSSPADLQGWSGETVEVSRGGRATYHGPSQILVYPIISLARDSRVFLPSRDVHAYLRCLEQILIKTLKHFGLNAVARTVSIAEPGEKPLSLTGVWIEDKKIASIGVAVRKWVTYHGVALNLSNDPQAFQGIRPCGFQQDVMTSMETHLTAPVPREEVEKQLKAWSLHFFS